MSDPTTILGKVGKKVGEELKTFRTTSDNTYATQVSLGTTASVASSNAEAIVSLSSNIGSVSGVANATKVSLDNYRTGSYVFQLLNATRAETTGDLTVGGDLTVNGTTTTINTQTLEVEDNIIEVNLASDGTETAQTAGIEVNRGDGEDKAQVLWNDGDGEFQLLKGSSDASLDVGSVDAEEVLIPSGGNIKINSVSLGDYSLFASALDTAKA
jgi:hypothetical protein